MRLDILRELYWNLIAQFCDHLSARKGIPFRFHCLSVISSKMEVSHRARTNMLRLHTLHFIVLLLRGKLKRWVLAFFSSAPHMFMVLNEINFESYREIHLNLNVHLWDMPVCLTRCVVLCTRDMNWNLTLTSATSRKHSDTICAAAGD